MSFDLHFQPRPLTSDGDRDTPSLAIERRGAERRDGDEPTNRDLVIWERIGQRLANEMPTLERSAIDGGRSYADADCGLALSLTAGEISLSAPSGLAGIDALVLVDMLRRTAAIVETVTGLVAYDAQTETSFLHDGIDHFEDVPAQIRELTR